MDLDGVSKVNNKISSTKKREWAKTTEKRNHREDKFKHSKRPGCTLFSYFYYNGCCVRPSIVPCVKLGKV